MPSRVSTHPVTVHVSPVRNTSSVRNAAEGSESWRRTIRTLRKERGLSQDVLSGLAGIARTHLTMIENGTKQANFETIWRLALALDMRPSELVARIERTAAEGGREQA